MESRQDIQPKPETLQQRIKREKEEVIARAKAKQAEKIANRPAEKLKEKQKEAAREQARLEAAKLAAEEAEVARVKQAEELRQQRAKAAYNRAKEQRNRERKQLKKAKAATSKVPAEKEKEKNAELLKAGINATMLAPPMASGAATQVVSSESERLTVSVSVATASGMFGRRPAFLAEAAKANPNTSLMGGSHSPTLYARPAGRSRSQEFKDMGLNSDGSRAECSLM